MHLIIKKVDAAKSTGAPSRPRAPEHAACLLTPVSVYVRCAETPSDDKTPKCNCVIC